MALGRRFLLLMAAAFVAATMLLWAAPVVAADPGGGETIEEFVCIRSTGDMIRLGTGKFVTTPSGNTNTVCTGKPVG